MPRTADWRSPEAAEALKTLDRPGFAWEFLRRNPEYREDYRRALERIAAGATTKEAAQGDFPSLGRVLLPRSRRAGGPPADDLATGALAADRRLVPAPDCYPDARNSPGRFQIEPDERRRRRL